MSEHSRICVGSTRDLMRAAMQQLANAQVKAAREVEAGICCAVAYSEEVLEAQENYRACTLVLSTLLGPDATCSEVDPLLWQELVAVHPGCDPRLTRDAVLKKLNPAYTPPATPVLEDAPF